MREMLHSIKDKARYWRRASQQRQFEAAYQSPLPAMAGYAGHRAELEAQFEHEHQHYITEVSAINWAVSLETACVLYYLCQQMQPAVVVDVGSGFSSYVLRTFRADERPHMTVYSVDDNADWLQTTRRYLSEHGLADDHVIAWEEFRELDDLKADLIFYDFATPKVRIPEMPQLLRYTHSNSVLVLDDLHKTNMSTATRELIAQYGLKYHDLREITRDKIGRFAWAVVNFN